jgi:hypothetical protein
MNNPFENKAIKFATEQELQHLAELARGYGLKTDTCIYVCGLHYFRYSKQIDAYDCYTNNNNLPEITYSDFIASLQPTEQQPDMVNHPKHYNVKGYEVIDIIEAFGLNFAMGSALKYLLRAERKGKKVEDLNKAIWCIQREIDKTETI